MKFPKKIIYLFFLCLFLFFQNFVYINAASVEKFEKENIKDLFLNRKFSEVESVIKKMLYFKENCIIRETLTDLYMDFANLENSLILCEEWIKKNRRSYIPFIIRGYCYINNAWKSRGTGWSYTVTKTGYKTFNEYLELAEADFEKAYKMNSDDPNSSCFAIIVATGLHHSAEKESNLKKHYIMEKYFHRVLNADPYHTQAHLQKLNYLFPKWHGTWKEVFSFARSSVKKMEQNPYLFIILSEAHEEKSERTYNEHYYENQENWNELLSLYKKADELLPDEYIVQAYWARDATENKSYEMALKHYKRAIEIYDKTQNVVDFSRNNDFSLKVEEIYNYYAWILATCPNEKLRNGKIAVKYARKAMEFINKTYVMDTLGAAYAEAGDFQKAVEIQKKAIEIETEDENKQILKKHLYLYLKGQKL